MKKVLLIAYHFPPIKTSGIYRFLRIGRWLLEYNWEPIVLTTKHPLVYGIDHENLEFVQKYFKKVYRHGTFIEKYLGKLADPHRRGLFYRFYRGFVRNLFIPDVEIIWVLFSVKFALKIIKEQRIDVILVTMNPYSSGLLGWFLKKKTGVPLILDYRDPWTLNKSFYKWGKYRKWLETIIEKRMLNAADIVTTTSKKMSELFVENKFVPKEKIFTVISGFDKELQYVANNKETTNLDKDKINITYVGHFYGDRQPFSFLDGLQVYLKKYSNINCNNINVNFVGFGKTQAIDTYCKEKGLEQIVKYFDEVSYKKAIKYCIDSDILLLINGFNKNNEIFIPVKIFDYLAVAKPILFIGEGAPADLINELNVGECSPHKSENIALAIENILRKR
ncbi:MAG: glycosyltransferase, partial [Candidatus Helarchaeota archaeon]